MSWGRVGRTDFVNIPLPGIITATGYDALDALTTRFSAEVAVGEPGGVLGSLLAFDGGSGGWGGRVHLFSTAFSASPIGTAWKLATADIPYYLGYVDVGADKWVSGGAGMQMARIIDQNIPLKSVGGARMLWGQVQVTGNTSAFSAFPAGGGAMWMSFGVLQD